MADMDDDKRDEEWGGMVLVAYGMLAAMIAVAVLLVWGVATLMR